MSLIFELHTFEPYTHFIEGPRGTTSTETFYRAMSSQSEPDKSIHANLAHFPALPMSFYDPDEPCSNGRENLFILYYVISSHS